MSEFFSAYKMIIAYSLSEFEKEMRKHIVEDEWEVFGDMFNHGTALCQQLVKYNEK